MMNVFRLAILTGLISFLGGCDLFPRRNAEANAALLQNMLTQFNEFERQGLLNPNTVSFVYLHRYGTSFGGARLLEGKGEDGAYLSAENMVDQCIAEESTDNSTDIRRCLKRTYAISDELRYSHAGIAYKIPNGQWYVRQSLRSTDSGQHFQWFGTLEEFVDIPLIETRIEVLVPTIGLQNGLAQALFVQKAGDLIIDPDYNLVAKPFQDQEQMSNQYVLELTAAALKPSGSRISRQTVQTYLREQGFHPDVILLGGLRSLAKWDNLIPTVDLSRQPYVRQYEVGEIITVRSVRNFLINRGHITQRLEITN